MLFPATGALFGEKTLKVAANLFSWPNLDQSTSMNQVDIQFERRGHPAAFVDWNPMSLKTVHTQFLSGNPGECDSGQAQRHCERALRLAESLYVCITTRKIDENRFFC